MRRVISNPELLETVRLLKVKARENEAKIWETVAYYLSRPRRSRTVVNLHHISRMSESGAVVVVPGKVLGAGALKSRVVVGAFQFSESAKTKIVGSGGKWLSIKDLVSEYPKGSNVQILR